MQEGQAFRAPAPECRSAGAANACSRAQLHLPTNDLCSRVLLRGSGERARAHHLLHLWLNRHFRPFDQTWTMGALEWQKIPSSLSELCINTTLRCGQSFRYVGTTPPKSLTRKASHTDRKATT